jgi:hypothetical protein
VIHTIEESAHDFRDHWAETRAEWSHRSAWLTSFVLPPTAVADAVSSAAGQMDLRFLVPVSTIGVHIPSNVSRLPAPVTEPDDLINARCEWCCASNGETPTRFRR